MADRAEFRVGGDGRLTYSWGPVRESRSLTPADYQLLFGWAATYAAAAKREDNAATLLALGRAMYEWLDGSERWLARLGQQSGDHVVDFASSLRPDGIAAAFLEAPWELVADRDGHLAADQSWNYAPCRRLGDRGNPAEPSKYRPSAVFMAAAPRTQRALDFEAEEATILAATGAAGIDLAVEESGTLEQLSRLVADAKPDVLHLSCHGSAGENPCLMLETDEGDEAPTTPSQLLADVDVGSLRLLFVSACHAGDPSSVAGSIATTLVKAGANAVLGFGNAVGDVQATGFASVLYRRLSRHDSIEVAAGKARAALLAVKKPSRDWHLARLYLGANGGGKVSEGTATRPNMRPDHAYKEFLDPEGRQIPVAGAATFVGRRRQIQEMLRTFRDEPGRGVLIHGIGRQGKSSLAARIANRMRGHQVAVVFGHYGARDILDRLARLDPEAMRIAKEAGEGIEKDVDLLRSMFARMLKGPFRQTEGAHQPVLLVVDDLERVLEGQAGGRHHLREDLAVPMRALLEAFKEAETESRLLLTSRYAFELRHDGLRLHEIALPAMSEAERTKQAAAKERAGGQELGDPKLKEDCLRLASGNAGLQDLLFALALADPKRCRRVLDEAESWWRDGTAPTKEELVDFLTHIGLGELEGLLSPGEREVVRAATLFELPVPEATLEVLAEAIGGRGGSTVKRLVGLGVLERYEDLFDRKAAAGAVNALFAARVGRLTEDEEAALASAVLGDLFRRWGGTDGTKRPYPADLELTRLALVARNAEVLRATGAAAVTWLENLTRHADAANLGSDVIGVLDGLQVEIPLRLLTVAGEQCALVGETGEARRFFARALENIERRTAANESLGHEEAAFLISHGRQLAQDGEPDEALRIFQRAWGAFEKLEMEREQAVVLGAIARIRRTKGEVDEALCLHQQALAFFGKLGNTRERAATLGDIAHIWKDKGEVDEALRLHQEALAACDILGDAKGRAVTLGSIARIRTDKGEVDEALRLHREELAVYEKLGHTRSRAVTLGDIARILRAKGDGDEALRLHQEELAVYEKLRDMRSRAVTLGDIARIRTERGDKQGAMELQEERLAANRRLSDVDEIAATQFDITRILLDDGDVQAALPRLAEAWTLFRKIGRVDGLAAVGSTFGQVLLVVRQREDAAKVLAVARDSWLKLGRADLARQVEDLLEQASTPNPIEEAIALAKAGKTDEALSRLSQIAVEARTNDEPGPEASALGIRAELLLSVGRSPEAAEDARAGLALAESLDQPSAVRHFRSLLETAESAPKAG